MRFLYSSVAMLAGVLAASPAFGAIDYSYTSLSLWQAAVSNAQTVTFGTDGTFSASSSVLVIDPSNSIVTAFTSCNTASASLTNTQVCFERLNSDPNQRSVTDVDTAPVPWGNRFFRGENSQAIQISMNPLARAFALDLYTLFANTNVTIKIYDANGLAGQTTVTTNNSGTPAYLGVTSDTVITQVLVSSSSGVPAIDTFYFANAMAGQGGGGDPTPPPTADSPESATLGYIGFGLAALFAGRKHYAR